ncbi:DNA alkylation repair protein [Fibrobacterales bacterium]|nr:DNA alkylation repair protein [Fibrobacterales bacterium]
MTIFDIFHAAANPEKAVAMSAYMRDQFKFLGIPTQERKNLSAEFLKTSVFKVADQTTKIDWEFIFYCWSCEEREFQYLALNYLSNCKAFLSPKDIPNLKKIATSKSWWDTIDCLDRIVGSIALNFPKTNQILLKWSTDANFWLRRIAIDHQIGRKEKTDTALLEEIIKNNFGQTEFFINKAIGWSLREYGKTNPTWVRNFIEKHKGEMSRLSVREGGKYVLQTGA